MTDGHLLFVEGTLERVAVSCTNEYAVGHDVAPSLHSGLLDTIADQIVDLGCSNAGESAAAVCASSSATLTQAVPLVVCHVRQSTLQVCKLTLNRRPLGTKLLLLLLLPSFSSCSPPIVNLGIDRLVNPISFFIVGFIDHACFESSSHKSALARR